MYLFDSGPFSTYALEMYTNESRNCVSVAHVSTYITGHQFLTRRFKNSYIQSFLILF